MCSMCHCCTVEMSNLDEKKLENGNSFKLDNGGTICSCKFCAGKHERPSLKQDSGSCPSTPMISPSPSLSSCDSCMSSYSDTSVEVNSFYRDNQEGALGGNQDDPNHRLDGDQQNSSQESRANGKYTNGSDRLRERNVSIQSSSGREAIHSGPGDTNQNDNSLYDDLHAEIWEPPEPEDPEDDMEGSVACNDDDDDECGDGTVWGKPSSLSHSSYEGSGSYRFKEEKQRAMKEVMNGKFKDIISELLKFYQVAPFGEDGESWVDVVSSLSWEAASFLKPNAIDGKAMDPDGYVKVKCIATGSRSQSQFVKGLVFKKHAAHKHMPTKYNNPRLLLIRGVLGQSSSGLSSFDAMEQEKDYLKSVTEMIESCYPNVVLVEKTVSRDIQEYILRRGMTLVLDMKLHRLERIARCTGSPILTSDALMNQKLKQCDSFHIDKFVEEHAGLGEGGKRPSKTLMFIEGCPTRLGCTILLKGTHSEELKSIKNVVQCAVVMAYHLILETSFLVDQKAMFSTIPFDGVANFSPRDQLLSELGYDNSNDSPVEVSTVETGSSTVDIPVNGVEDGGSDNSNVELECSSTIFNRPYNPAIFSGFSTLSASLKKVVDESLPLASYFGFHAREPDGEITNAISVLAPPEAVDHCDVETKGSSDEECSVECGQSQSLSACSGQSLAMPKEQCCSEDHKQSKDGISTALDSRSILVLMSSRNASRGTICEQSHFSHIMFYKNFDIPLGKFLEENLLNQRNQCSVCGELPEAHFYYYAHHNRQLTIQVKPIPGGKCLPGKMEGKLWMWSRCGKCKSGNGITKCRKRVLISTAARGLSFGKFLELSFSQHSSSTMSSSCGHSLYRDFLYFFGLGSMVAMFRYSDVATYTVSMPPQKLEFSNSIRQDRLLKETENVYMKGMLLFTEVANSLKRIRSQFESSTINLKGSPPKEISGVEDMLKQEQSEFEVNIRNAVSENGNSDQAVYRLLRLNRLLWDILLESCIWDRRIHSLLSPAPVSVATAAEKAIQEQVKSKMNGTTDGGNEERKLLTDASDRSSNLNNKLGNSLERNGFSIKDTPVECRGGDALSGSSVAKGIEIPIEGALSPKSVSDEEAIHRHEGSINGHSEFDDNSHTQIFLLDSQLPETIPISIDRENTKSLTNLDVSKEDTLLHPQSSNLENSSEWFWTAFAEIRQIGIKDIQKSFLPKFESISSYTPEYLPTAYQLITEEGRRLHIPLGNDSYIVSDYEGELSSIIACILALLKDQAIQMEVLDPDKMVDGGVSAKSIERIHSSSRSTANGNSDPSDSVHSTTSLSSEESRFSSFDGLNLLDSLVPDNFKATEHEGIAKSLGKGKYLVSCPYFNRFRDLRSRCCPSELDYIASLSRCRKWDAKGGKSKSFFAKTIDDRFIIKEIKRTEYDSFIKFALDYFQYMNQSFELGNQTCLAKVLGIYQVTVRQAKSGKEMRHDLVVMENLTFGRKITRQYDLKGALHARYNSTVNGSGDVLLDQNFVNDMNSSPLYVSNKAKRLLQRAVWNDTSFLNSINVMDYSLLVGIDTQRRELVCGIIDYLRQYTWDKHLETWVKSSLVPKNVLPTVVSPKEYKRRFRKFMSTHFLSVPDHWCLDRSSDPWELSGVDNASRPKPQKKDDQNGFSS